MSPPRLSPTRRRRRPRPPRPSGILRDMVLPGLAGSLAGVIGAAALLAADVGGLRTLMGASPHGWIGAVLLGVGFAVTFGSASIGAAVMALGAEE
jgi:hypothetical protein